MITPFAKRAGAGNTASLNFKHSASQSNEQGSSLQAISDRMDRFQRLQRAFNALDWNLHYLDGDACLAVHRKWQMSQVCQDFRAATALLRKIGGAA